MARKNMVAEDAVIYNAINILSRRVKRPNTYISSPVDIRNLIRLHLIPQEREVFVVVYLDARHGVIAIENVFFGNLTGAAIYVGQVVRKTLLQNAAAVVVAHNHPSGVSEPSQADRALTERLRTALELVEVRLLDHLVIGGDEVTSFAERGYI